MAMLCRMLSSGMTIPGTMVGMRREDEMPIVCFMIRKFDLN